MELISTLFHFLTDKSKGISSKVLTCILAVFSLIIIDNVFNFSSNFNNQYKIDQIEKINVILKDTSLTKPEKQKILALRINIINHKSWKDNFYDFISDIKIQDDSKIIVIPQPNKNPKINTFDYSYFWHFISSSWLLLFAMIGVGIASLTDKKTPLSQAVAILIIAEPVLYGFCWVLAKLFSYLAFFENPVYNYILNAILCFGVFLIIGLMSKAKK